MKISNFENRIKSVHPSLILGLCLLITVAITFLSHQFFKDRQNERLNQFSDIIASTINSRIASHERSLRHIYAYLKTNPQLTRERYHAYVEHLITAKSYPGVQGLGFSKRIKHKDLKAYEESVRKEGFEDFKVWPDHPREEYHSIHFLEPFDWRNKRAFGFDMYSQPIRQKAMAEARDSGKPSISDKVVLVQETDNKTQPGFLIYLPVYSGDSPPATIEERREKLLGFVYAPFRSFDFFNEAFTEGHATHQEIKIEIYDGDNSNPDNLLYTNDERAKGHLKTTNLKFISQTKPFGHTWTVITTFRSNLSLTLDQATPWILLFIGSILSFLIFWVFHAAKSHSMAIEISLTRFNALVTNLTEGIIIAYPNGDIQLMNKVAAEIYQFDSLDNIVTNRAEYNKLFTFRTLSGEEVAMEDRPIGRVLKGEKYSDYELEFIHTQSGKSLYVSYGGTPIMNKTGKLVLVVLTVKDITYRKKIEMELREALMVRDEFISISSHELKTPLTSLKLKTQMFLRKISKNGGVQPDESLKFAENINHHLFRLTRLVDDMLDVSRLRSGKFTLSKTNVNFCELVQNALDQIRPQFLEAGYSTPELLIHDSASGYWDPLRVEQVINNLLTNVIRYGGGKPVTLEVKCIDQFVQLAVKDQGNGISPEQQDKIFNRFERLTHVHETTGLGLGLFLSQKIIEAHGGKIWVESKEGVGSTFYFTLPLNSKEGDT